MEIEETFIADGNELTGNIPSTIGFLTRLGKFRNALDTGFVLASHSSHIEKLEVDENRLEGEIPDIFETMTDLGTCNDDLWRRCMFVLTTSCRTSSSG